MAAPLASRHLADLGARVIKVERPDGGDFAREYDHVIRGQSSHFVWLNRGKESLVLDLKRPRDLEAMRALLARADVFIQNLAPGAVERLGLDPQTLQESNLRLVTCSISGYGSAGPYRDRRAYDLLVQAESGVMSTTGTPAEPAKVGIAVADIGAGMYAFSGILAALLSRAQSGRGAILEVSLFDALVEWLGFHAAYTAGAGAQPVRSGARHPTIEPYGPFDVAGGTVYLGVQNERQWRRLCEEVLGRADLLSDPRFAGWRERLQNRVALKAEVEAALAGRGVEEVMAALAAAQVASSRYNDVAALLEHPLLEARDRWREVSTPGGEIRATLPPLLWQGLEPAMGPVAELGQHTDAILAELGY